MPDDKRLQTLEWPLPRQIRITRVNRELGTMTVSFTTPIEVLNLWSMALEFAGRMTGSDHLGALLVAMSLECLGEWQARVAEHERKVLRGTEEVVGP